MRSINLLLNNLKDLSSGRKHLFALGLMIFFFAIFDGIFSFITPIFITQQGISESMMGIIIGTSSIAGLIFDLLLCRYLKDTKYRLIYFLMFIICFAYPLILWGANSVLMFIIAMAFWGLYYDLFDLAKYDFITRKIKKNEYSASFGILGIFIDLGYLLGPFIAGFLFYKVVGFQPFLAAWIFLGLSLICYFIILNLKPKESLVNTATKKNRSAINIIKELVLWKKIGNLILPILCLTFFLNIIDSFYWTIGPLLTQNISILGDLGSLFMVAYIFPPLIIGWFVGSVTNRLGKKKTAFYALLASSLIFCLFTFINSSIILIAMSFGASFCLAFAWPAISGAYADYMNESPNLEKEINTLQDSFTNLGYIIGPIIAGFSSQYLGHLASFSLLGLIGLVLSLIFMKITPKHIIIKATP